MVCSRCQGKGFRDTPVVHMGMPGTCYGCDGDGSRATELANKQKAKIAKQVAAQYHDVEVVIWDVARANGDVRCPPRDRRRSVRPGETFTTEEYAQRNGLSKQEAWVELCRWRGGASPVLNAAGQPVGWSLYG